MVEPVTPEKGPRKLFVVQRRQFSISALEHAMAFGNGSDYWQDIIRRYPKEVEPLRRAFAQQADAAAFLAEREQTARAALNLRPLYAAAPMGLEKLLELTAFDPPVFLDWLEEHEIPRPPKDAWDSEAWEGWLAKLTPRQVTDLFKALHKLTFYELFEIDWIDESDRIDESNDEIPF
jgi:hypothetical protein